MLQIPGTPIPPSHKNTFKIDQLQEFRRSFGKQTVVNKSFERKRP